MKNTETLSGIRLEIFKLVQAGTSKFNDIKKLLNLESNDLSYHLKILQSKGFIEKIEMKNESTEYFLTSKGKLIYPMIGFFSKNQKPVFAVTAVAILDKEQKTVYLQKKPREPDKGKLIFFGSKCVDNLTIEESARHYVKEQAKCEISSLKLKCINEYILRNKNKDIENHWIVYFYTSTLETQNTPTPNTNLISKKISQLKQKELFGDNYYLIKNMLNNKYPKIIKTEYEA